MSELYARPRTLRAATLSDMAELLHAQRARALDVVAPASAIRSHNGLLADGDRASELEAQAIPAMRLAARVLVAAGR